MNKEFAKSIISIIKSALDGKPCSLPADFDFEKAYRLAIHHNVVVMMYYGIVNSGVFLRTELGDNFLVTAGNAVSRTEQQKNEIAALLNAFEKHGIDYLPLKGTVIRALYPKEEMRAMGDSDILIREHQYERISEIMAELGYTFFEKWDHVRSWNKHAMLIELHNSPMPVKEEDYYSYYKDGWHLAKPCESGKHRFELSDEDCWIFLLVHFAKHYRIAGIGIRHVADMYLYWNSHPDMDKGYIKKELEKIQLYTFSQNVLKLVNVWFSDAETDDITNMMTEKILGGGAFGTADDHRKTDAIIENKKGKGTSHFGKFMKALFMPYKDMCILFPFLKRLPFLLPFMWIWRIIHTAIFKRGRISQRLNEVKSLSREGISAREKELEAVGLKFNFKGE